MFGVVSISITTKRAILRISLFLVPIHTDASTELKAGALKQLDTLNDIACVKIGVPAKWASREAFPPLATPQLRELLLISPPSEGLEATVFTSNGQAQ